ncbi:hypothetical protein WG66_008935 [Moniliophthora roreri]|nr:hypothetical protein WG66_008935 [Moniliophthora roreri]
MSVPDYITGLGFDELAATGRCGASRFSITIRWNVEYSKIDIKAHILVIPTLKLHSRVCTRPWHRVRYDLQLCIWLRSYTKNKLLQQPPGTKNHKADGFSKRPCEIGDSLHFNDRRIYTLREPELLSFGVMPSMLDELISRPRYPRTSQATTDWNDSAKRFYVAPSVQNSRDVLEWDWNSSASQ